MTGDIATILLVEDDASIRLSVQTYLRALPVRIVTAENGQQALEVAETDPPDLILLDVMMPVMNGYQFLRAYRQRHGASVPVIVITAKGDSMDRYWSEKLEVTDYFQKPFDWKRLKKAIEKALATAPLDSPGS